VVLVLPQNHAHNHELDGLDIDGLLIKNIYGDGLNIFDLADLNGYLGGLTYDLMNGGPLTPDWCSPRTLHPAPS
jgi:hypothetical protein